MVDKGEDLGQRVEFLERQVAVLRSQGRLVGIRKRSRSGLGGLPWYDIAMGPDPESGQLRGHARGVVAIGDMATGVLALGGLARGVIALGGLSVGLVTFGGLSLGLLLAFGGVAVGAVAVGGAACGLFAVGGGAFGYYACGGGAFGKFVVSAVRQDPEAVEVFGKWLPIIHGVARPGR